MFERYTDRARRSVVLAQEQARMLHHREIDVDHMLLGLAAEGEGSRSRRWPPPGRACRGCGSLWRRGG
jgi:hypothetical protein